MTEAPSRILVIKLGALGDFVQATGPFAAIRRHHAGARVTMLTTEAFTGLARASGFFDEVWVDPRPSAWNLPGWLRLRRRLRRGRFARVYDLQTNDRTRAYFLLLGPGRRPEWSGVASGCSHPHANPARARMHVADRQAEQLAAAGIAEVPPPDLSFVAADVARFRLPAPYVLLVPGGAAHRPDKRWPAAAYAGLAMRLARRGLTPVVLGAAAEGEVAAHIAANCPAARDLTGETGLEDVVGLARAAAGAVGNDTGPMHLIAVAGCPATVLFSAASDPALSAPRGAHVTVLRRDPLAALSVDAVERALALRSAA